MKQAPLSPRRVRAHAGVLAVAGALAMAACDRPTDATKSRAQDATSAAAHPAATVAATAPGTSPASAVPAPVSRGPAVPPAGHGTAPEHGEAGEVTQGTPSDSVAAAAASSSTPGGGLKARSTQR